jgi:hypothetical protein
MGGYPAFAGHPWHHYWAVGGPSVFALFFPALVAIVAIASWRERRSGDSSRRGPTRSASRAIQRVARSSPAVLASDAEREESTRLVAHAVGEGRLTIEEGEDRVGAVLRARHRHELAALVADLPHPLALPAGRFGAGSARRGLVTIAAALAVAAIVLQALAGVWELWPIAVVAFGTVALLGRR